MPFDTDIISGIEHGVDCVNLIQVDQESLMTAEPAIWGEIRFPVSNTVTKEILPGLGNKNQLPKYHLNILPFFRADNVELSILICNNAEFSAKCIFSRAILASRR